MKLLITIELNWSLEIHYEQYQFFWVQKLSESVAWKTLIPFLIWTALKCQFLSSGESQRGISKWTARIHDFRFFFPTWSISQVATTKPMPSYIRFPCSYHRFFNWSRFLIQEKSKYNRNCPRPLKCEFMIFGFFPRLILSSKSYHAIILIQEEERWPKQGPLNKNWFVFGSSLRATSMFFTSQGSNAGTISDSQLPRSYHSFRWSLFRIQREQLWSELNPV